jgi:hypothetical protein
MFLGLYIGFAILVGIFAIGQRGGFLLYFILSLILTPIVSLLILIIAAPDSMGDRRLQRLN